MRPGAAAVVRAVAAVLGTVLSRPAPPPAPISLAAQRQWLLRHGFLHNRAVPPAARRRWRRGDGGEHAADRPVRMDRAA